MWPLSSRVLWWGLASESRAGKIGVQGGQMRDTDASKTRLQGSDDGE